LFLQPHLVTVGHTCNDGNPLWTMGNSLSLLVWLNINGLVTRQLLTVTMFLRQIPKKAVSVYLAPWGKCTAGVISPLAKHDWLKRSHDKFRMHNVLSWSWHL